MGDKQDNIWLLLGRYTGLAFLLPICVFVGYAAGYLLDNWLGTGWLKIVGVLVGIAAGFLELFRELKQNRDE